MTSSVWQITFAPMLPWPVLAVLAAMAMLIILFSATRGIGGVVSRAIGFAVVLLALANPRHVEEQRAAESDVALLVIDKSASQSVGDRRSQVDQAIASIREKADADDSLELREVVIEPSVVADDGSGGTDLYGPLSSAATSIPPSRYAGAVVVSDGQIHDLPSPDAAERNPLDALPDGPLHVLLSGERDSFDRRVAIDTVPAYSIVGKSFEMTYQVIDSGGGDEGASIPVELRIDGEVAARDTVISGGAGKFEVTLDHAGVSVIEVVTPAAEGELSTINNAAVATVNAVRDRLRVLLVSGQPHSGERTWRNLLKSDPAVDLIHFTILRPPDKSDFTPIRELALITFPTFELFELKLQEFDLVVFDRYVVRFVLSPAYFRNIRDYVTEGGAVMLAVGPEYAGQRSLFDTPLGEIAPARPVGNVIEEAFRPSLTDAGERHPVTAGLGGAPERWGRWLRQIPIESQSGEVLMRGVNELPLLVLSRVGEGRVGFLASDQVWLWARDFEGGGPHAELIRRTAHWLMREPALEEEQLSADLVGEQVQVERRSLSESVGAVELVRPDGSTETMTLAANGEGVFRAASVASGPGVYRFENDGLSVYLAVGDVDPLEYRDLRATDALLGPMARESRGLLRWLTDSSPDVRRPRTGRDMSGGDWLGLRANESYVVTGLSERPLLPPWLVALLVGGALFMAWWRESHVRRGN